MHRTGSRHASIAVALVTAILSIACEPVNATIGVEVDPDWRPRVPAQRPIIPVTYLPVGPSPVRGAPADDALVTIVEFSDFACPMCERSKRAIDRVMSEHPGKVRQVFRYRLQPTSPSSLKAATVASLAHDEGQFWRAHDLLFAQRATKRANFRDDELRGWAHRDLGLPAEALSGDLTRKTQLAIAELDTQQAKALNVWKLPTFFVNGVPVVGTRLLHKLVRAQLRKAALIKSERSLAGEDLYEAVSKANASL